MVSARARARARTRMHTHTLFSTESRLHVLLGLLKEVLSSEEGRRRVQINLTGQTHTINV